MKELIKRIVIGTFLEPLAVKVHAFFTPTPLSEQYNIQTTEIMNRTLREDSSCIDIGCHKGLFLKEMLKLAPKGTHFAIEPIPEMFHSLKVEFGSHENVRLYECALSDTDSTSTFQHVISNPGYSGLRRRKYDRPDEEIQEIEVKTTRLDNLIPKDMTINFIKVDVEGAEYQVFKGAIETIRRCRPIIVFEHGLGGSDYYGTTPELVYDLMAGKCGLRLFLMAEWLKSNGRTSLDRDSFCEQFSTGKSFYFMAAP